MKSAIAQPITSRRGFEPYAEYVDSGISWMGRVPRGWGVEKLKFAAPAKEAKREFNVGADNYVGLENIESGTGRLIASDEPYQPESVVNAFGTGDVLFGKLRPYLAKALRPEMAGTCTSELLVLRPNAQKVAADFLFYRVLADDFIKLVDNSTYGTKMPRASWDFIGNIKLAWPPKPDQQKIIAYLDEKMAAINGAVEKKRRQVGLLKEKRVALINQAVTKGLDPKAELVDSGFPWLGKIPRGWAIRKIARSFKIIGSGATPNSGNESFYEEGDINWVLTGDLNDGTLYETSKKITKQAFISSSALKMYPVGTLLIAMYGATIGRVALLGITACTNQACCAISRSPYFDNRFVYYWFIANRQNIVELYSYGSGQPNISQDVIRSLHIQSPRMEDQQKIAAYLDEKTAAIDGAVEKINRSIELLTEYKSSLITNVVTGKVMVA